MTDRLSPKPNRAILVLGVLFIVLWVVALAVILWGP